MTPKVETLTISGVGSKAVGADAATVSEPATPQSLTSQSEYFARLYDRSVLIDPPLPISTTNEDGTGPVVHGASAVSRLSGSELVEVAREVS